MYRVLLLVGVLSCFAADAQRFAEVTTICTVGAYTLRAPVTEPDDLTFRWEVSMDGGQSWSATGRDTVTLVIAEPRSGTSYRVSYAGNEECLSSPSCRTRTDATRLLVDIPSFSQGLSICGGDSVVVGDTVLATGGTHTVILATAGGCDSVVTTFIQLRAGAPVEYFPFLCPGQTYRGQAYFRDTVVTERFVGATGCDSVEIYNISVAFSGEDLAINGPEMLCYGETAELSTSRPFAAYDWEDGSTSRKVEIVEAGTYRVTVTDFSGCRTTLERQLEVSRVLIREVEVEEPICPGTATGRIDVAANDSDGTFLYSIDGGVTFQQADTFNAVAAGRHTVLVENENGCLAERPVVIPPSPTLNFNNGFGRIAATERGDSVRLTLNPNFEPLDISWQPARSLSCMDCLSPQASPVTNTDYIVMARSPQGCPVTDTFTVVVTDRRYVYAPNAFSPNDDGENDRWRLFGGDRIQAVSGLQIRDRQGNILYEQAEDNLTTADRRLSWDGLDRNHDPLPTGVYFYTARIRYNDGYTFRLNGTITLIN